MSHYDRGASFERKVRDKLLADGAKLVIRSAGSKGPVDLVALYGKLPPPSLWLGPGEPLASWPADDLVQVKTGRATLTKKERAELVELAESVGARAVLAEPVKNGRKVDVKLTVLG